MDKAKKIKLTFFIDSISNTFSMWFDDPKKEIVCDMNKYEDILSLDKKNKVIGFEKINFFPKEFIQSLKLKAPARIKGHFLLKSKI